MIQPGIYNSLDVDSPTDTKGIFPGRIEEEKIEKSTINLQGSTSLRQG